MEYQETAAWESTAALLKRAVASGDLVPGKRGWKARQRNLVRAHLNAPQARLRGRSLASVIAAERVAIWVEECWNGPTRQNVLGDLSQTLQEPTQFPDGDLLPPWRWLLEQLEGGIPLTQNGNLGRAFVRENAERFGWDFGTPPRFEDDVWDLRQLHALARRLRLTRRSGRTLGLSPLGRRLLADPAELWRKTAAAIIRGDEFTVFTGELFLAVVLQHGPIGGDQVDDVLGRAATDERFADAWTYTPVDQRAVSRVRHETSSLCRALGMLAGDEPWPETSYEFTAGGAAVATEALRVRANRPVT